MIEFRDFSFRYADSERYAAEDITMTVRDGDFVGITGHSGAGKTTIARAISGIIPHCIKGDFYGSVIVDGLDTVENELTVLSKIVGSVCQDIDSAMVASDVEDEILYGLENFGVPADEIEQRVTDVLEEIDITELRNRKINSLSGGQKQKVAIAAILALRPKILVLDEPTGELDPESSRRIFSLLRSLSEKGITVIVVEQKIMLLCEFAKRLVLVDEGKIIVDDTTENVLENSRLLEECGVNCPRVVTLANKLRASGIDGISTCTDTESTAEMLRGIMEKRGECHD